MQGFFQYIVHSVMKIVIDCGPFFKNYYAPEDRQYIINALARLQREKSLVEFLFLADRVTAGKIQPLILPPNLIVKKTLPGIVGWKIWYRWGLPAMLQKTKADLLFSTGGITSPFVLSLIHI